MEILNFLGICNERRKGEVLCRSRWNTWRYFTRKLLKIFKATYLGKASIIDRVKEAKADQALLKDAMRQNKRLADVS